MTHQKIKQYRVLSYGILYNNFLHNMVDVTMNDGNKPLKYNSNDWFYMKTGTNDICNTTTSDCNDNQTAVNTLQTSTDDLGASMMKYNDATMLYNRELLFMVNILAGIVLICYYIYINQSAIPSPASVIKGVGASSWTSNLAMSPSAVSSVVK